MEFTPNRGSRGGNCFSLTLVMAFLLLASSAPAVNPVNSWINPGSGYWEDSSSWLLGLIPDQSQSIMITNAGWKAVVIGTNAAQKFPQSLQVQGLQIASPTNSYNTLLLNFTGFELPLQTTGISIATNSAVVVQGSSLEIVTNTSDGSTGNLNVGGTFSHGDFSQVKVHGRLSVGLGSNGQYYLTNGTLSVDGGESLGQYFIPGTVVQYGGSNLAGNIQVNVEGEYDFHGGQLSATNGILVGDGDYATTSSFYQYGGNVNADMTIGGRYYLYGGTVSGRMAAPGSSQRVNASIYQSGGTNFATSMDLSHPNKFGGAVSYVLTDGAVHVESSTIFRGGWFYQYNGQHTVVSNFVMQGVFFFGLGHVYAEYLLAGGTLSVGNLTEPADAHFNQTGGTNLIADDLTISGVLHYDDSSYTMDGGTLAVKNITIGTNAYFQHITGNIIHSGTLTLAQGTWSAATGDYSLGPLQLSGQNTNWITFPGGSSILRLANSSTQPWASGAILTVNNWHGSISGSGATQLYFGSNASGLTSQQLAQVRFSFSNGAYPATILPTGEVVPVSPPALEFARTNGTVTLTWGSGWFLQSSTNVAGPYQDVQGATSPWPASMTRPHEFFRLRH